VLHQLDEDPSGAPGVQEGDPVASGPKAGVGVDELDALAGQAFQVG
jgi:hypothetical protein